MHGQTLEELFGLHDLCEAALQRRSNFPFQELVSLVERAGFLNSGGKGSHTVWSHPTHRTEHPLSDIVTLQSDKGKAKPYQIKQVVKFIRTALPKEDALS